MAGFWSELAHSGEVEQQFDTRRQHALKLAEDRASSLQQEISSNPGALARFGVSLNRRDRVLSFKKDGLEVLVVVFGYDTSRAARIASPIVEYLNLSPSAEDVHRVEDVSPRTGFWLTRSLQVMEKNRKQLSNLGLV